uniref:AC transposase n=1 Tax=Cajanus cajan TaxID=3821 RepID=A0A151QX47_CAJCA|nr:Putative AC transposase [Cajanus cajan]
MCLQFLLIYKFATAYIFYIGSRRIDVNVATLNSNFLVVNTVVSNLWGIHDEEKVKVKNAMHKANSRTCLTSDCWTCITQEGYICVTAHFVDSNWKLNSKILAFSKLDPPHGGHEMAKKIFEILLDCGIDRKVFSITLDNASANDTMVNFMKAQFNLQNSLICNGSYFHVRCSALIPNLIVQEGLGVASGALKTIRESIKYVRGSKARKIAFKECVLQVRGIDTKVGLRMDVPTRWNSTYVMLDSAIKYKRAFGCLAIRDRNYVHCPSDDEWNRAARMCEFLKEYVDYLSQNATANGKSELDLYLEEGNLDPKFHEKLDVLAYWRDRHDRYPNLSRMACDVLSIPITTVASESAFSLGSRVLTKYRSTILPENVELLILTQNWLHGFEELGNFYNENFLIYFYNNSS